MELTRSELGDSLDFYDGGFILNKLPENLSANLDIPTGRYELPRKSGEAYLYRITHPLAQAIIDRAKKRDCPPVRLIFDYQEHNGRISTLEPYRGRSGQLIAKLISISALGDTEQHILIAAVTENGEVLQADDPEKLLRLPAHIAETTIKIGFQTILSDNMSERRQTLLNQAAERNLGYFEEEEQKLDDWADDLKQGLEQNIKETDREIKEVRRTAAISATLEEKLRWQKKQRELENKRSHQRRELFDKQDEIEAKRNQLIEELEESLKQKVEEEELFFIEWEMA